MKHFEITSKSIPRRSPDDGFYQVELREYPRCTIAITDLSIRTPLEGFEDAPKHVYNETDGEGTNYHYEIVIAHVDDEGVPQDKLEETIDYCWDWLLTGYLL